MHEPRWRREGRREEIAAASCTYSPPRGIASNRGSRSVETRSCKKRFAGNVAAVWRLSPSRCSFVAARVLVGYSSDRVSGADLLSVGIELLALGVLHSLLLGAAQVLVVQRPALLHGQGRERERGRSTRHRQTTHNMTMSTQQSTRSEEQRQHDTEQGSGKTNGAQRGRSGAEEERLLQSLLDQARYGLI